MKSWIIAIGVRDELPQDLSHPWGYGGVRVVHFGKNSATPLRLPFQYGATPVDLN